MSCQPNRTIIMPQIPESLREDPTTEQYFVELERILVEQFGGDQQVAGGLEIGGDVNICGDLTVDGGPVETIIKDGCGTDQAACVEENGGLAVNVQDQHTRALDLKFAQATNQTTLTVATVEEDQTITVANTAGFIAGRLAGIFDPAGRFYFGEVISVLGSVVTVDTHLDYAFAIGSNVVVADTHLNVVGTLANPEIFQIGPVGQTAEVDITRIMGNMTNSSAMDDGTFGGLSPLTNGCVLRQHNGVITNIWNVKSNGDIGLLCFDAAYTTRAPGGENGFRFRNTYAGQGKHGVTLRLEAGDTLEILIQDDLTDLTDFQMMAQGHLVGD